MKKVILTYGLISGAIVGGLMLATMPLWKSGVVNFDNGEVLGYTTMVISLSLVFFGIKSCRDNQLNGFISFGQGVKVGLLITLISSVLYAIAWEVSFHVFVPDFTEKMSQYYLEKMKTEATNDAEVKEAVEKMNMYKEWYKNPLIRFAMTMIEIFPVGLVITLLSAALLRKKQFLPAQS